MTAATPHGETTNQLKRGFGWLAVLGAVLVIAGLVGLVYAGVATLTSMLLFGWLLLIGGLVGLLHAIQARGTNFFWLGVIVAALNIAAGVVVVRRPDARPPRSACSPPCCSCPPGCSDWWAAWSCRRTAGRGRRRCR